MGFIIDFLSLILGLVFNFVFVVFRIILAFIAGGIAAYKKRSVLLWGIGTLIFPWAIIGIIILPKKYPKLRSDLRQLDEFRGKQPLIASFMALSAIVAKADGVITKEKLVVIKEYLTSSFGISREQLDEYEGAFNYGKKHPEEYREFARVIASYYKNRHSRISIAYLFCVIAMSNGSISDAEDEIIRKIVIELGVSEYEYLNLKNHINNGGSYSGNRGSYGYGNPFSESKEDLKKKYTEVLGVDENASFAEIKKAYRKAVKEYHPDKIASQGMPENYAEFAKQKTAELNEAYDYLKKINE